MHQRHRGGADGQYQPYGVVNHPLDFDHEFFQAVVDEDLEDRVRGGHFDNEPRNRSNFIAQTEDYNKTYKSYPLEKYNMTRAFLADKENWQEMHPAKRFSSVILAEEIESFN